MHHTRPRARQRMSSGGGVQSIAEHRDELVDLGFLDDERRRELDRVAAVANVEAGIEALHGDFEWTLGRLAGCGVEREPGGETEVADVADVLRALERVDGVLEVRRELANPRDRVFGNEKVDR